MRINCEVQPHAKPASVLLWLFNRVLKRINRAILPVRCRGSCRRSLGIAKPSGALAQENRRTKVKAICKELRETEPCC